MILHIAILLSFQLIGEVLSRIFIPILPGPVLGLVLLLLCLIALPRMAAAIRPTADGLLAHLSLLFVPAGVGIIRHIDRFTTEGPELALVLVLSTGAAIAVAALAFVGVSRLTGGGDD